MARAVTQKLILSFSNPLDFPRFPPPIRRISTFSRETKAKIRSEKVPVKNGRTAILAASKASPSAELLKRRTRSAKEFDREFVIRFSDKGTHIPVMLGEVVDVFASSHLRSFVDCTLGAAGHSSAIIQTHPELQVFIGLDVDQVAHQKARARINTLLNADHTSHGSDLGAHMLLKNFREIKNAVSEVDQELLSSGVDGILMDLGMSSMQVDDAQRGFSILNDGPLDMRMDTQGTLKAEDILNSWPAAEIGRILREYGEESNWRHLQHKIVKAREEGGLHSTKELVNLIQGNSRKQEGRQGWIKTSSRVFQGLRIAVNDELRTLKGSLHACFDCLRPGGRLAVISFHSLEDRIVKQTFLDIINSRSGGSGSEGVRETGSKTMGDVGLENEAWIKQTIKGESGVVLTKRPLTATAEEESLNCRCRSAKLRVVQKTQS